MEDSLLVLLGISGSLIVGLLGVLGVVWKRNGHADHNPNFDTMDAKLNAILLCLTRIEAKLGGSNG